MLWGGIRMEARTELVVVNGGAMTANRYTRDILEPHVVPFALFIGNDSILMRDNARPHIAQIVNEYLDTVEKKKVPILIQSNMFGSWSEDELKSELLLLQT
jgi:hypothetical protein